jgi:hypothetical protein
MYLWGHQKEPLTGSVVIDGPWTVTNSFDLALKMITKIEFTFRISEHEIEPDIRKETIDWLARSYPL